MENQDFTCKTCSKENGARINPQRFIAGLDRLFASNDVAGAGEYLRYWEKEARFLRDDYGLLTVLNEIIGYSRRINDKGMGLNAIEEARILLKKTDLSDTPSGAVIDINMATTLNAFGKPEEGMPLYEKARRIYEENGLESTYEYAALLNNQSTVLTALNRFDEAEECIEKAVALLDKDGNHDGEIAISLINLAHLVYDRNDRDTDRVEELLDTAWEYINSPRLPHDSNYAFVLSKCAPSLRYFQREMEAQALEEVANEIYGGCV